MRKPGLAIAAATLGGLALAIVAAWLFRAWRDQEALAEASRALARREFEPARQRLLHLAARRPADASIWYQLGLCERALDHPDAALRAWERISSDSSLAPRAEFARANLLNRRFGRLSEAEPLYRAARRGPEIVARGSLWALFELFLWQGRLDEARALLEDAWSRSQFSDRVELLKQHWRLESLVVTAEDVRDLVDAAAQHAPADPHAQLVAARLATDTGRLDEARIALDRARAASPNDPAIARAFLAWALAADRPEDVERALRQFSPGALTPRETLSVRSWAAARRGDRAREQRFLTAILSLDPSDPVPLERLGVLAHGAGDARAAAEYRRRKADLDRIRERYRWLVIQAPAEPDRAACEDLARVAESLGRDFEARGWWTLALAREPSSLVPRDALARIADRAKARVLPADALEPVSTLLAELPPTEDRPRNPAPTASFADAAEALGLSFTYQAPRSAELQVPEVMGGGVALFDYDGDGWLDVFVVQGGPRFPIEANSSATNGDRLFRNRGDGTFVDVSDAAGISSLPAGFGFGVTAGDFDGDGHTDLFVTRWRAYLLLRNRGDGTFEDATAAAGLAGDRDWPTSAAFADFDQDGDLDLYVCHYIVWDALNPTTCRLLHYPDRVGSCLPRQFPARPDHLFRNDGGRFVDVTGAAGIVDADGRGLGVVAADLDSDGLVDLYVANDQSPNYLFRNRGQLRFEEVGFLAGAACGADGVFRAGMGVACGDLDGDGWPDLAVTNFYRESSSLFRNLGDGTFTDATARSGLGAPSLDRLGFGIAMFDANNDGHLDLATANGHVNDERPAVPCAMASQLFLGGQARRLIDVSDTAGPPWKRAVIGRALAIGDLDNDGRLDVVIVPQREPMIVARNTTDGGHWLTLALEGTRSNRGGVGACVTVRAGGRLLRAWSTGGGSYQSASEPRLHFGLGPETRIDELTVAWPSGRVDRLGPLAVRPGAGYRIREGAAHPLPLAGFAR
jgi:tetratricopeptide (TPR) repeat protein